MSHYTMPVYKHKQYHGTETSAAKLNVVNIHAINHIYSFPAMTCQNAKKLIVTLELRCFSEVQYNVMYLHEGTVNRNLSNYIFVVSGNGIYIFLHNTICWHCSQAILLCVFYTKWVQMKINVRN